MQIYLLAIITDLYMDRANFKVQQKLRNFIYAFNVLGHQFEAQGTWTAWDIGHM